MGSDLGWTNTNADRRAERRIEFMGGGASGRTEMATTLSSRSGRLYRQAGVIGIKAVCEKITVCVFLYMYVFLNV